MDFSAITKKQLDLMAELQKVDLADGISVCDFLSRWDTAQANGTPDQAYRVQKVIEVVGQHHLDGAAGKAVEYYLRNRTAEGDSFWVSQHFWSDTLQQLRAEIGTKEVFEALSPVERLLLKALGDEAEVAACNGGPTSDQEVWHLLKAVRQHWPDGQDVVAEMRMWAIGIRRRVELSAVAK